MPTPSHFPYCSLPVAPEQSMRFGAGVIKKKCRGCSGWGSEHRREVRPKKVTGLLWGVCSAISRVEGGMNWGYGKGHCMTKTLSSYRAQGWPRSLTSISYVEDDERPESAPT